MTEAAGKQRPTVRLASTKRTSQGLSPLIVIIQVCSCLLECKDERTSCLLVHSRHTSSWTSQGINHLRTHRFPVTLMRRRILPGVVQHCMHGDGLFFSHFCACAVRASSITVSLSPASPQTPPRVHVPTYLNLREAIPVRSLLWFHVLLHSLALWYPLVAKQCGYCCYLRTYSAVAALATIIGRYLPYVK